MWDIIDKESRNEIIPPSVFQHTYRSDKGTDTAIAEQVDLIESGVYRDKFVLVISMDMQGAFDNLKLTPLSEVWRTNFTPKKPLIGTKTSYKAGLLLLTCWV